MGYFVKYAHVQVTPVNQENEAQETGKGFHFGVVNSDSGYSCYDDGAKKALKYMGCDL